MAKISVIVPVYNAEKYLGRCVDSILGQTFSDFELLLIDDGSTDESGAICDEYVKKDSRVRVFHKPNGGVCSARNMGLDNAIGEWITFCDSDDYTLPCWLENYDLENTEDAQLIQQGAFSDKPQFRYNGKSACQCGFDYIGSPSMYLNKLRESLMMGFPWMKAYRKDIIKNNKLYFDKKVRLREDDIFLLLYLACISRVKSIDKPGYFYLVPNWKKKYVIGHRESSVFYITFSNAFLGFVLHHGLSPENSFYSNIMIDGLMKVFATSPRMKYFTRITQLVDVSYDNCALFRPLKWLIHRDKSSILAYPALLTHSILRNILKK